MAKEHWIENGWRRIAYVGAGCEPRADEKQPQCYAITFTCRRERGAL